MEIDPDQAARVVWIYEQYAAGNSCQAIAAGLNREHVRGPRGGTWAVSALYGSPNKGSGVLNNELYIGRYIWNRSQWVKDPDSHKRVRVERPRNEWHIVERPDLRIVTDELWQAARARIGTRRTGTSAQSGKPLCRRTIGRASRSLFGGLMRCGLCNGAVVVVDATHYGCAAHKDRGPSVCAGVRVQRNATNARLLSAVKDDLLTPQSLAEMQAAVSRALVDQQRDLSDAAKRTHARVCELDREIENLVSAVASMGISPALAARLETAELERKRLTAPSPLDKAAISAIKDVGARYRRLVMDLENSIAKQPERARQLLSKLIGKIQIVPVGDQVFAELDTGPEQLLLAAGGSFDVWLRGQDFFQESPRFVKQAPYSTREFA